MGSSVRLAARVDSSQAEIVSALRAVGAIVVPLCRCGVRDVPDLLVGVPATRRVILVEVKTPGEKPRPPQRDWLARWPGETAVVTTVDEALQLLGAIPQ